MVPPTKRILIEYKSSLVVQMFEEQITHVFAKAKLELLCDIEVFFNLTSMLECILKFIQVCLNL
jgi:hypothetical protein